MHQITMLPMLHFEPHIRCLPRRTHNHLHVYHIEPPKHLHLPDATIFFSAGQHFSAIADVAVTHHVALTVAESTDAETAEPCTRGLVEIHSCLLQFPKAKLLLIHHASPHCPLSTALMPWVAAPLLDRRAGKHALSGPRRGLNQLNQDRHPFYLFNEHGARAHGSHGTSLAWGCPPTRESRTTLPRGGAARKSRQYSPDESSVRHNDRCTCSPGYLHET